MIALVPKRVATRQFCSIRCRGLAQKEVAAQWPMRFWAKVIKQAECWPFTGAKHHFGYGVFRPPGKAMTTSHRVAWELTHGPIPDGQCVLHRCDNPPCCNPDHLFLGTQEDNARDRVAKRRTAYGENAGPAKLKDSDVIRIRGLVASGVLQKTLCTTYGISRASMSQVVNRKTWRHLA